MTAASVAPNGSSVTINTPSFLTGQYTGSYAAVINNVGAGGTSSAVAAADIELTGNDAPCQRQTCSRGWVWNSETCLCEAI